ncbi:unnamed protein product [Gongylonema pulchrum]|uniref:Protein kinase domain-containing protein n=1 Tax=Gongylonema pulchrum TaxID=637853 RepID=A0A183E5G7_9BILA|nr:unnamed protein product [Gongylonema pulchrum]
MPYSFRVYAFNEYFKGKMSQEVGVDLKLSALNTEPLSIQSFDAEVKYIDENEFNVGYALGDTIHRGQFADVKQITRNATRKRYVAKCFSMQLLRKQQRWDDVEREIRILRTLQHRNIVAYHAAVKTADQRILIMQRSALRVVTIRLVLFTDQD